MSKNKEMEQVVKEVPFPQRNKLGLFDSIKYPRNSNGFINWRAMVDPSHLFFNQQYAHEIENIYSKPITEISVNEVDDKYLLVRLAGLHELAFIRGYSSLDYTILSSRSEEVIVKCSINWIPNIESNLLPFESVSIATANLDNTYDFARNYLPEIASNRAFCRCVRNSLRIHVVSADEIGPQKRNNRTSEKPVGNELAELEETEKVYSPIEPRGVLQAILRKKNKKFSKFVEEWIALGNNDAANWKTLDDIPPEKIYAILEAINKKKR